METLISTLSLSESRYSLYPLVSFWQNGVSLGGDSRTRVCLLPSFSTFFSILESTLFFLGVIRTNFL